MPPLMHRALLLIPFALLSACSGDGQSSSPEMLPEPLDASAGLGPFVPRQMRIFPLSHIERQSDPRLPVGAKPRVVCHIEFTDRWYDTVKAVGHVQVQLYRSGGSGFDVQHAKWDVDLTDLTANAEWFDPVTRTYRLQLNLPDWAIETLGDTCRIAVIFTPAGAPDQERAVMRDEITLRTGGPGSPLLDETRFPENARDFRPATGNDKDPQPVDPDDGKNTDPPR